MVNLYPFQETLKKPGVTHAELVEKIDIGGPTWLRAGGKNYLDVTVLSSPADYQLFIDEMREHGGQTTLKFRGECAARTFALVREYDEAIANYFASRVAG
ncbi:MAG: hypothetical protein PHY34_05110 [Patescibacteria group bacterium]|nr:hypothetical protein [Patescibacteria group bacterium]MDD5715769.1 hypothetical protein [Patescibacteria group bacterium]